MRSTTPRPTSGCGRRTSASADSVACLQRSYALAPRRRAPAGRACARPAAPCNTRPVMVVGVCRLTLMVHESHSLKEKRMVLRRIKDRTRLKFNVAIAEVGDQDAWQSAQIGYAVVANERGFVESMVGKIEKFIEELGAAKIVDDEKDYVTYGDGEMSSESF